MFAQKRKPTYDIAQSQLRTVVIYSIFKSFVSHSIFALICICDVSVLPPNAFDKYDGCKIAQTFCPLQCGRPVHLLFMYNIPLLVVVKEFQIF